MTAQRNKNVTPPRNILDSRKTAVATATASYTREKQAVVGAPALSLRYNRNMAKAAAASVHTEPPAASSTPTPSVRVMNKSKRDYRHIPTSTTRTPVNMPPSSTNQLTSKDNEKDKDKHKDNTFSRFMSTGKTRTFGNATMSSHKPADTKTAADRPRTATRNNFRATSAASAPTTPNAKCVSPHQPRKGLVLKSNSGMGSFSQQDKLDEDGSQTSLEEGSSEVLQPAGGGGGAAAAPSRQKKVLETDSTAGILLSRSIAGGKVNVRDFLRSGNVTLNTTRTDHARGGDANTEGNRSRRSSISIFSSSPRHDASKDREGHTPRRNETSKATVTTLTMESNNSSTEHRQESVESKTSHAEKDTHNVDLSNGNVESGQDDNSKQVKSYFHSLASYNTANTYTSSATTELEKNKMCLLRRGSSFEQKLVQANDATAALAITPLVVENEEDEAASAAAIELRNARRRFRLSRDAAAAAAASGKKTGSRREFKFVASSNPSRKNANVDASSVGGKSDAPGSPGQRAGAEGARKGAGSPLRTSSPAASNKSTDSSPNKNKNTSSSTSTSSPTPTPSSTPSPPIAATSFSTSYGNLSVRVESMKSCLRNQSVYSTDGLVDKEQKRRVRFHDHNEKNEEKFNYANMMKPKVVIRVKPPQGGAVAGFDTPAPRNVEEALLFSKLKAENLNHHEETTTGSRSHGTVEATPPLSDSARSDATVSLERDEYLTFDKESFVF
jgi:hypothetical protein